VEDAVRQIAQMYSSLGSRDPRLNPFGDLDFRLLRQQKFYGKLDSPPSRVKPIPLPLLLHAHTQAMTTTNPTGQATTDMAFIAYFSHEAR